MVEGMLTKVRVDSSPRGRTCTGPPLEPNRRIKVRKWLPCGFYDFFLVLLVPLAFIGALAKVFQSREYVAVVLSTVIVAAIIAHFFGHRAKETKRY